VSWEGQLDEALCPQVWACGRQVPASWNALLDHVLGLQKPCSSHWGRELGLGQTEGKAIDFDPHKGSPGIHCGERSWPLIFRFGFVNRDPPGSWKRAAPTWPWQPETVPKAGRSERLAHSPPGSRYSAWQLGGLARGLRVLREFGGKGKREGPGEAVPLASSSLGGVLRFWFKHPPSGSPS
jgi:hypothetical protein